MNKHTPPSTFLLLYTIEKKSSLNDKLRELFLCLNFKVALVVPTLGGIPHPARHTSFKPGYPPPWHVILALSLVIPHPGTSYQL
jgi:hypothetical protein